MRPWSPREVKFCECRKSLNSVPFDVAVRLPHISQPLSVWPFHSFIGKFEHILAPCVHSLFTVSPCRSLTAKNKKKHYSCSLSTFSSLFLFLLFCSIFVSVKLGLVKAQATYFWDKQGHSESLRVSGDSSQVCGFFRFPFLWGKGERM